MNFKPFFLLLILAISWSTVSLAAPVTHAMSNTAEPIPSAAKPMPNVAKLMPNVNRPMPNSNKQVPEQAITPIQTAATYKASDNINIAEYFISEKLDGVRARWTGTQLITRNGNVIYAPKWFTDNWPNVALDGELWTQRSSFEAIASIVLSHTPDERWRAVKMMVFDMPISDVPFASRVSAMESLVRGANSSNLAMISQFTLSSQRLLEAKIDEVTAKGGEGLILHHKGAFYQSGRSNQLLKAKRYSDAEAKVIGYVEGKGKFAGMLGSLIVETPEGIQFKIGTGFSMKQRQYPPPMNSWITFKYFGLTKKGIPRFASFRHIRPAKDLPNL
ncbi:DNA ligase [Alteromonas sp. 1_MG-2023]|uniref:DNA ligase n=1 Tax=Alteromonas sp. 1_MG-2023 TaxID=3062669 RepID=UPI0026E197F7|nr:DNA ligase [Alteromonas sp. 1_MG-2023]MDO6565666.1 DNA ligase [Alteromonas sp. 1_MG-2023]